MADTEPPAVEAEAPAPDLPEIAATDDAVAAPTAEAALPAAPKPTTFVDSTIKLDFNANAQLPSGGPGLSPMVATAFTGAVEAHNALLERLRVIENTCSGLGENQYKMRDAVQELSHQHQMRTSSLEQRLNAQDARLGDLTKSLADGLEAQKNDMNLRLSMAEADFASKLRTMDEKLSPELQSLHKAIQDLAHEHSQLMSRHLPQFQAELGSKIQHIETDLAQHKSSTLSRERDIEEKLSASNATWSRSFKEIDDRLRSEVNVLGNRLTAAEGKGSTMAQDLAQTSARLDASDQAILGRLESKEKELQAFANAQVGSSQKLLRTEMTERLTGIEDALKQETFERMQNTKTTAKAIEGLGGELYSTRDDHSKRLEASHTHHLAKFEKLHEQVDIANENSPWTSELKAVSNRLQSSEDSLVSLQNSLRSSDDRLESTTQALLGQLQAQNVELEKKAKEEASGARAAVRADEGSRVTDLEASLKTAQDERNHIASTLGKEIQVLRDSLNSSQKASFAHADDAAAAVIAKLDPVKQAVSNLSQDIDEITRMQEQFEGGFNKLEDQVGGIQRKAAPIDDAQRRLLEMEWYLSAERQAPFAVVGNAVGNPVRNDCLSCGRRAAPGDRSASPTRGGCSQWSCHLRAGALSETTPAPLSANGVGWSQRSSPQPPRSARPASASYHRHLGADAPEAAAVGSAVSAARYQRNPKPAAPSGHPLGERYDA